MSRTGEGITCRMGPSKWRPNHIVPTYFVSPKQRKGCFGNINDAINFAQPFSRIELLPGRYVENVYLNKALEISTEQGQEPAEIVASSTGYAFTFATPEAFVEGICVKAQENALRAAVRIDSGHPTLVRCEFSGIEVSGDATPMVDECKIHGGAVNGIYVLAQAGGTYRSNKIENQGWFSIHVESSGSPLFLHNRIRSGAQGQVMVDGTLSHTNPSFQYNRITDENEEDTADLHTVYTRAFRLERLPVKMPGQVVNLMPQATASLIGSIPDEDENAQQKKALTETRSAVVILGREAMPVFQRNTVVGCGNNAFRITDGAKGIYEHNYVSSNDGWGFVVEGSQTEPILCGNSITCNGAGIKVCGSKARITGKNEVLDNRFTQLLVENAHADFKFVGNEVRSGSSVGIHCRGSGQGLIEQNVLDQCAIGIRVEDSANPLVRENQFPMCGVGAFILRAGLGRFEDNEFDHSSRAAVIVSSFGNPTFTKCKMMSSQAGIIVTRRGRGLFDGCILKDNKSAQIEIYDYANPEIFNCAVIDGREEGISIHHYGRGYIHENMIAGNDRANVAVRTFADPVIHRNVLTKAHEDGLVVEDGGMGTITNNIIERCKRSGLVVMNGANPLVRANHVSLCKGCGLHVLEGGLGTFEKNEFILNIKANVWVAGEGVLGSKRGSKKTKHVPPTSLETSNTALEDEPITAPQLLRNVMAGSHAEGLLVSNYASVMLKNNIFSVNNGASVKATTASTVSICNCIFDLGQDGVVAHDDNTTAIIANNCFFHQSGSSISADLGAKIIACYNTFDQCAIGVKLANSVGHVFDNAFVRCSIYGASLLHMCKVRLGYNAFIECDSGIHVGTRSKAIVTGNAIRCAVDSGAIFDGEDVAANAFEGNVVIHCHQGVTVRSGNAKLVSNWILNNGTGISLTGAHCNPTLSWNYVSCCDRGVLAVDGAKGRIETSLIGHCDIGVEICEGSGVSIRQSIIHNSSAIGVSSIGPCEGDIFETQVFKNFVNFAAANEGCVTSLLRCVLQASVVASCVVTSGAKPAINRCAILSRATGRDAEYEDAGDLDALPKRLRSLLVKKIGVARAERIGLSDLRIPSLWDDLYTETVTTRIADGFPAATDVKRLPQQQAEDAATVASATSAVSHSNPKYNSSKQRSSSVYDISYVTVTKETVLEYPDQTVLEVDTDDDEKEYTGEGSTSSSTPHSSRPVSTSLRVTLQNGSPLSLDEEDAAAGKKKKKNRLTRRTAILYPSNISDTNIEASGPGGPMGLHRIIGADTSVGMRGLYTYMSSGVIVADGGSPALDGCVIRDHVCKEIKVAMRKRTTATGACEDATTPLTPSPPTNNKQMESSTRKRQNAPVGKGRKSVGAEELLLALAPAAQTRVTTFTIERGLFACDTTNFLHRLLLVGSPAFYQRRGAPLPEAVMPELFPFGAGGANTVQLNATLGSLDTAAVLSTAGVLPLLGCAVLVIDSGKGVFNNCALSRNNVGVRIVNGGDPLLKYTLMQNNNLFGIEVLARGLGTIRQCRIAQNRSSQASVVGPACRPVFTDTDLSEGLVGMQFSNSSSAEISNCTVHDIGNTGVVIESLADPVFSSTKFLECMVGMEVKKEGRGTVRKCIFSGCRKEACVVDGPLASPQFLGTLMSESSTGLRSANGARPSVTDCEFFENGEHGLEVHTEGSIRMASCKVYDNCGSGIMFRDRSVGEILSSEFCTNRNANICVMSGSTPRVAHCYVFDGESDGIFIENASPSIELTRIYSNGGSGIAVTGSTSLPTVLMCEVDNCEKVGVMTSYGAGGVFKQLVVTNCIGGGILAECKSTHPVFDNMYIKANGNFGASFRDGSRGELRRSILSSTLLPEGAAPLSPPHSPHQSPAAKSLSLPAPDGATTSAAPSLDLSLREGSLKRAQPPLPVAPVSGLHIATGADPKVSECVIVLQPGHGIYVESHAFGDISDCVVGMCRRGCVSVVGARTSPRLRTVTCFDSEFGIEFQNEAGGVVTSCLLLGGLRRAGVLVGPKCSPMLEQCLAMRMPTGVIDVGHGRYAGCYLYLCNVGMELNGHAELDDCEFKDCSVGIQCTSASAAPTVRTTTVIQSARMGFWIAPEGGSPSLVKCNFNRNRNGIVVDGGTGGSIESCELFNNNDCLVINDCHGLVVKASTFFDAQHAGIVVKGGNPTINSNLVFDCTYAGIHLETGEGEVEDNRAFFPREDGAIVQEPTSKANVGRNNVKNSWSPPQERSVTERSSLYKRQEQDREKPPMTLRRIAKAVDASHIMSKVAASVSFMASQLSLNPVWVVDDKMVLSASPSESMAKNKTGILISGSLRDDDHMLSAQPSLAAVASSPLSQSSPAGSASGFGSKVFTPAVRAAMANPNADKKRGQSTFIQWRGPGNESYARRVLEIPLLMGETRDALAAALVTPPASSPAFAGPSDSFETPITPVAESADGAAPHPPALVAVHDRLRALLDDGFRFLLVGGGGPLLVAAGGAAAPGGGGAVVVPTKPEGAGHERRDSRKLSVMSKTDLKKTKSLKK